jgi:hypothetical protein
VNSGTAVISITGTNFMSSSTVRFNYQDRPTNYINSKTLQVRLSDSDLSSIGDFPITVGNMGPGGGLSNSVTLNVNNNQTTGSTATTKTDAGATWKTTDTNSATDVNSGNTTTSNNTGNGLSANALFASKGFLPSNFLQWIAVFFLILFIILIWRKLYSVDKYNSTPLKHS